MNARTVALLGTLAIVIGAGVVLLRGEQEPAVDFPRPSARRSVHGASESPATVRPAGLMINAPVHTGEDPESGDSFGVDLAFFGSFERTRVALELHYPKGGIIDLDNEASAVARFEDDRGSDLRKQENTFGAFEMMPRVSEDGRYLVFVAASDKLPDPAAARVAVEGTAALQVASSAETFRVEQLELSAGTEFSVGGYDFEITEVGPSAWGEGHSITLKTDRDTTAIVRYGLVDAAGNAIELSPSMSMTGMGSWSQTLDCEQELERATFELECWQDLQTVQVPFSVEAGIGLR